MRARVAAALRGRPALTARLALAPRRAIHAVAAFVQSSAADRDEHGTDQAFAERLLNDHPRDLLAAALGVAPHPRLYRLLDRAALPAWPVADYAALDRLLRMGADDALARDNDREIEARNVASVARLLDGDPTLLRARLACTEGGSRQALAAVLAVLRASGVAEPVETLPDGSGHAALARRLRRAVAALGSPHAAFPAPPGWKVVASVADLWLVGARLRVCCAGRTWGAAHYASKLASGASVFLHGSGSDGGGGDVLAEVARLPGGVWAVEAIRGARNARPPAGRSADALTTALRAQGLAVASMQFEQALNWLVPRHAAGRAAADLDDAQDDGDAGEWL